MEYSSTTTSYEEYRNRALKASEDESVVLVSFADYGSAVFGHRIVPAAAMAPVRVDPGPGVDEAAVASGLAAERSEVIRSSPAIAFFLHGAPLSRTKKELSSLQELLSVLESNPAFIPFVDVGSLCLVDYSQRADGRSVVLFVQAPAVSSAPRAVVQAALPRWRTNEWMAVLGLERVGTASLPDSVQHGRAFP